MKDYVGTEIEVGDSIVYAKLLGRSAGLNHGLVVGFKEMPNDYWRKPRTKIKVEIDSWDKKKKVTTYLEFPDRVIVTKKKE